MQRAEGPQTPFETYCYDCRVTFAAGTQRCIHCGRRLSGTRKAGATSVVEELGDGTESSTLRRAGGISLWVLIALGAAITRMCGEGG